MTTSVLGATLRAPAAPYVVERGRSRVVRLRGWLRAHTAQLRHAVVSVVAFGSPTAAAFTWHLWAGLVATGAAVLLIDYAVDAKPSRGAP